MKRITKGFTLVELLVSVSIMILMATMTGPGIMSAQRDQELMSAAVGLKAELLEAQSLSMAPPVDNKGYNYYGLKITPGNDRNEPAFNYQIFRKKDSLTDPLISAYAERPISHENIWETALLAEVNPTLHALPALPATYYVWFKIGNLPTISFEGREVPTNPLVINLTNDQGEEKKVIINSVSGTINVL